MLKYNTETLIKLSRNGHKSKNQKVYDASRSVMSYVLYDIWNDSLEVTKELLPHINILGDYLKQPDAFPDDMKEEVVEETTKFNAKKKDQTAKQPFKPMHHGFNKNLPTDPDDDGPRVA